MSNFENSAGHELKGGVESGKDIIGCVLAGYAGIATEKLSSSYKKVKNYGNKLRTALTNFTEAINTWPELLEEERSGIDYSQKLTENPPRIEKDKFGDEKISKAYWSELKEIKDSEKD